jgi:hypothetical protein
MGGRHRIRRQDGTELHGEVRCWEAERGAVLISIWHLAPTRDLRASHVRVGMSSTRLRGL